MVVGSRVAVYISRDVQTIFQTLPCMNNPPIWTSRSKLKPFKFSVCVRLLGSRSTFGTESCTQSGLPRILRCDFEHPEVAQAAGRGRMREDECRFEGIVSGYGGRFEGKASTTITERVDHAVLRLF